MGRQRMQGDGGGGGGAQGDVVADITRSEDQLNLMPGNAVATRLATRVCRLIRDRMERGPTEPHAGRSTFLLSSGGAGGAGITEWPMIRSSFLLRTCLPAGR